MVLTIRLLGCELLHVDLSDSPSPEPDEDTTRDLSGGTVAATALGYAPSPGDQRWREADGPDLE